MATTPAMLTPRERHALWLGSVRPDVEELHRLAGEWATLDVGERVSWSHTWDQDTGMVENLVLAARRGELAAEHRWELADLVRRLEELTPVIEALGLWIPQLRDPSAIRRRGHDPPVLRQGGVPHSATPARRTGGGGGRSERR